MADGEEECCVKKAIEACATAQAMIDINAKHLDGLRTQCVTSVELTQNEIRTLETKLIKLFSRQLITKRKCPGSENVVELKQYPRLRLWLQVVGVTQKTVEGISKKVASLEDMLEKPEQEVKSYLNVVEAKDDEKRRFLIAMKNLKTFTDRQFQGEAIAPDLDLHWDSWDRVNELGASPRTHHRTRAARSSVPSEELLKSTPIPQSPPSGPNHHTNHSTSSYAMSNNISSSLVTPPVKEKRYTPPPTPPIVGKKGEKKFPTTPPPIKRHQTNLLPDAFPLTKSKSHEEHLENRIDQLDPSLLSQLLMKHNANSNLWMGSSCDNLPPRRRLATEPGLDFNSSPLVLSPSRSPPVVSPDQQGDTCFTDDSPVQSVVVPRSPRIPPAMAHTIRHRFTHTVKVTTCQLCDKQMFFGYKCKECKFRCHRDCVDKVPPSCGLPDELVNVFAWHINEANPSPVFSHPLTSPCNVLRSESGCRERKKNRPRNPVINIPPFHCADSSSNTSSCNSSTPSSPALVVTSAQHTPSSASRLQTFHFPDISNSEKDVTIEPKSIDNEMVETQKSTDSDRTVSGTSGSGSISTDSEKTLGSIRVDSQDSQVSDMDPNERAWPRQNSLSLREWDIPFDEVLLEEKVGEGRFGVVYRGNWHGSVAVKMLNMDHVDDKKILETFKQEVATFRKTRHENLVLFMGACMKPPQLAIITSLCKGMTLYRHIHLRKDKFNLNGIIVIALQICQGMGYLHARGIVHKDLKTKNIFYENGKVIITDFGLFSVTKLCRGNRKGDWLTIPQGWLCYLAPEVIRSLKAGNQSQPDDLPFTTASDAYAFGTVWYELLCGEWPFRGLPAEAIIWQVGRGMKQSLANIQASQDIKDFLMFCWAFKPAERPEFAKLQVLLTRLPKKRLARSPSHPIHLSRSAESVF